MEIKDMFMLCESCQDEKQLAEFDRARYKANIKFDGIRCLAIKKGTDIFLVSRGNNIITYKFREVVEAFSKINSDFMIDGEIINIDNTICGNFNLLSKRALTKDKNKIAELEKIIPVKFIAFDILSINGKSVMNEPLTSRIFHLRQALAENLSDNLEIVTYGEIDNMLIMAIDGNGEGIVIKDMNGVYESRRSKNWYKHKLFKETTINITGFTENNAGIRATDNEDNAVQISGNQSNEVRQILESVGYATINVQYLSKGKDGRMRFPSFRGLTK